MEGMKSLNYLEIQEYICNRYPLLMVDYVEKVIPGSYARGFKNLTNNDWFFREHFPGDNIMPGSLQIEAITQMCAIALNTMPELKGNVVKTVEIKSHFMGPIVPGDKFEMEVHVNSFKRGLAKCTGKGIVDDRTKCELECVLIVGSSIEKFLP